MIGWGNHRRSKGQAATELAVFGAILIFLIGSIIRTGLSNAYTQNENLKAMRWAMAQSWESSKLESTKRNSATVLYIEDRLSADFGKYGSLDRTPFVAQGTGTFSNMLMYPVDYNEPNQLGLMDVFVNGVHLTFTTANWKSYSSTDSTLALRPPGGLARDYVDGTLPTNPHGGSLPRWGGWNFKCFSTVSGGTTTWHGCPMFYTIVPNTIDNYNSVADFCDTASGVVCDASRNNALTLDEQYDLNRNDSFSDDPKESYTTIARRKDMAWRWKAVNGYVRTEYDPVSIDTENGNYPSFDVDGDRKEETIYGKNMSGGATGVITSVNTLDFQAGDVDFSRDIDQGEPPGLTQDSAIYTRPRNLAAGVSSGRGTFLQIKEGKLFVPGTSTMVRSISKKDQVDVIERRFQLTNDTGRMCDGSNPAVETCVKGVSNVACTASVESGRPKSGTCFDEDTVARNVNPSFATNLVRTALTCFDCSTKTLYIRSRLLDAKGHKWVGDASGDLKFK